MSTGWTWYVIALVVLNIVGYVWLLQWTARRRPGDPKPDDTLHTWDGDITEYNKPLPRWWINLFYITIVFGIGYLFWYGGMGSIPGYSGWTSKREHATEKAVQDSKLEETFRPYTGQPIDQLAKDPAVLALGRSIFANTCATCHGSSAKGVTGYPNLTDNIWHWGGEPDTILQTVLDGREGIMPPWGPTLIETGGPDAVNQTIAYVRSLSATASQSARDNPEAAKGKALYDGTCIACHGENGKGNQALGSPDLTDGYWLYGSSDQSLRKTINEGRHGTMPAHRELLGETRARVVAAYVWSLSHGQDGTKPAAGTQ